MLRRLPERPNSKRSYTKLCIAHVCETVKNCNIANSDYFFSKIYFYIHVTRNAIFAHPFDMTKIDLPVPTVVIAPRNNLPSTNERTQIEKSIYHFSALANGRNLRFCSIPTI